MKLRSKRITPRTCLWPLAGCVSGAFILSIGLTYRSNHHCYAATCGEWLFPLQARLHVGIWYLWLSISIAFLGLRAFQPRIRELLTTSLRLRIPLLDQKLSIGGLLVVTWICCLYGALIGIWWSRLSSYFEERGRGLPGNSVVAAVALTGHLADVTMGLVLLPVSRHSALASFFQIAPSTTIRLHMIMAYVLMALVLIHGSLYASWAALYNENRDLFRPILPVLNPTYLYNEVWPGDSSSLGVWRASLIFTGIVSSLIMLAMFCTSFPAIRTRYFNLFYFTHLFGIVAVIIICLHASTMLYCTLPGLSMWVLDWSMRLLELQEKIDSQIRGLGNGWFVLTLPLPRKRLSGCACHSPLAHFYIHHSKSSLREVHPFTTITHLASKKPITSEEDRIMIQFLFRESMPRGKSTRGGRQWTNKVGALVDEEKLRDRENKASDDASISLREAAHSQGTSTPFRMEGPYFTAANPEKYRTVVCLVAGTGLSGALAIAAAFEAQRKSFAARLPQSDDSTIPEQTKPRSSSCTGHWQRCLVVWSVRESEYVAVPFLHEMASEGVEIMVHKTGPGRSRLDVRTKMLEICGGDDGSDCWAYISGPSGFITAAEQGCSQIRNLNWFAARWD